MSRSIKWKIYPSIGDDGDNMSIKLDSFILPDNVIDKMKDTIKKSSIEMIEKGFSLCNEKNDNILKIGNYCGGSRCAILRPSVPCKNEDEYRGLYHTHPSGKDIPSIPDLLNIYEDGLGCIGSKVIKCFVRKDPNEERKTHNQILNSYFILGDVESKLPKEDFQKLYDAIAKYTAEKNFNIINVE